MYWGCFYLKEEVNYLSVIMTQTITKSEENNPSVQVGGSAVCTISGTLLIP